MSFWFGLFLAVSGSFVTFFPGAECGWFIIAGVLLAFGVLIPKLRYRTAAVILCSLCFFYAYSGYVRGIEYRKWLKEQDTVSQVHTLHNIDFPQSDPGESVLLA